eukprot:TRINITY_DN26945_c0_g1_i1.p2 TRINITY_DN26945_c0_g1~~TRINITY_DN26945_c0_g1_i1.p2  ORF type:complete len:220 (-),score=-19.10 TRINITY_DN26945_c0_g1_i1:127-786(-)
MLLKYVESFIRDPQKLRLLCVVIFFVCIFKNLGACFITRTVLIYQKHTNTIVLLQFLVFFKVTICFVQLFFREYSLLTTPHNYSCLIAFFLIKESCQLHTVIKEQQYQHIDAIKQHGEIERMNFHILFCFNNNAFSINHLFNFSSINFCSHIGIRFCSVFEQYWKQAIQHSQSKKTHIYQRSLYCNINSVFKIFILFRPPVIKQSPLLFIGFQWSRYLF